MDDKILVNTIPSLSEWEGQLCSIHLKLKAPQAESPLSLSELENYNIFNCPVCHGRLSIEMMLCYFKKTGSAVQRLVSFQVVRQLSSSHPLHFLRIQ